MRCSACYAENPPWATICTDCGKAVLRLEFCAGGHLLPPGAQECPVCPHLWPEVTAFDGAPLLRGILLVEKGRLTNADDPADYLPYVEIRDREQPLVLTHAPNEQVTIANDDAAGTCRVLMRPEGVQVCGAGFAHEHAGPRVYKALGPDDTFVLGTTTFRHIAFDPPAWSVKLAESRHPDG